MLLFSNLELLFSRLRLFWLDFFPSFFCFSVKSDDALSFSDILFVTIDIYFALIVGTGALILTKPPAVITFLGLLRYFFTLK